MKQTLLFAALGLAALGASAQDVGRVISRTPVVQQVAVPRQVCNSQYVQRPTTGGGTLLGGLTGAAIGSGIGHGGGTAAAVVAGTVLGAVVGNNVEQQNNTMVVPNCVTENVYENRTVAWNVTYEYRGQQYTTQMAYDPGSTVRLRTGDNVAQAGGEAVVTAPPVQQQVQQQVQPAIVAQADVQPQVIQSQPQYVQTVPAPVTVYPAPMYPAPVYAAPYPYAYPYPYYRPVWPIGLSFSFGGGWGHRHHH